MSTLISHRKMDRLAAMLEAAGDDWARVASEEPVIADTHPGNDTVRDTVTLRSKWGMEVNDGTSIAVCPPTMYRTEDGTWHGVGWSNYSPSHIYRPTPQYDPDAGVHSGADVDEVEGYLNRARIAHEAVTRLADHLDHARAVRDRHIIAASQAGISNYRIAKTLGLVESSIGAVIRKTAPKTP